MEFKPRKNPATYRCVDHYEQFYVALKHLGTEEKEKCFPLINSDIWETID